MREICISYLLIPCSSFLFSKSDIERQGILYIEQMKNEARSESSGEGES